MRVSRSWLESMVPTGWDAATLAHRLTMAGFEVEGISRVAGEFDSVVVGRVLECEAHPGADRLKVTRVDAGQGEILQIVCGASNVRAGLVVPVALVGAQLPGGVAIKRAKLRGVESAGMLCSGRELAIGEDAEGLLELPGDLPVGASLRAVLDLDDVVLEVNATPNRGDALSVLGLARELSVLSGVPLTLPDLAPLAPTIRDTFPVTLASAACGRFASRVLTGLDPAARTPAWMQERLRRAGQRSLGPLIDVTNYVMLELGQPMHAYDRRALSGGIVVRQAQPGETLTLLDGRALTLQQDVTVIADGAGAVGLAGIMGGEKSGIAPDTTEVLLEVAWFAPGAIAGRARRHGLVTEASQRFERGVDPTGQVRAIERASALLVQIAGGSAGPVVVTEQAAALAAPKVISLRDKSIKRLIGIDIDSNRVGAILSSLGLGVQRAAAGWSVTSAPWRFDLSIEADLIEEVARVYGYNEIPEIDAAAPGVPAIESERRVSDEACARLLCARGYHEAINYTFVDPAIQQVLFPDRAALSLANPLSAELAQMRVSLWPGLVRNLKDNVRRQSDQVRLFEIGARFVVADGVLTEIATVAGIAWGRAQPEQWGLRSVNVDFYDAKADVEALIGATRDAGAFTFRAQALGCLHPGVSAAIYRGEQHAGWLGELHPQVAATLGLDGAVYVFELDIDCINSAQLPVSREISRFPHIRRDIAVIVDESTTFNELQQSVTVSAAGLLRQLKVFDVYRGKGIETGRKSVALGLILQETSRTLTDAEADAVVNDVTSALQRDLNAVLRD